MRLAMCDFCHEAFEWKPGSVIRLMCAIGECGKAMACPDCKPKLVRGGAQCEDEEVEARDVPDEATAAVEADVDPGASR